MRTSTCLAVLLLLAPAAGAAAPEVLIVQFNGKQAGKARADTRDKAFKAVFEKDLKGIAARLPGKPDLVVGDWFTIINGGSVKLSKGGKAAAEKLKAELEKLPYVRSVELDVPTPPPSR